jgi:hypothetical protein
VSQGKIALYRLAGTETPCNGVKQGRAQTVGWGLDDAQQCAFCKKGRIVTRKQELAFRQWTDRGYAHCRVEVPIGICDRCGSEHWNQEADAIVEEAVRREYDKLPATGRPQQL